VKVIIKRRKQGITWQRIADELGDNHVTGPLRTIGRYAKQGGDVSGVYGFRGSSPRKTDDQA
jgi:hypothetical protein